MSYSVTLKGWPKGVDNIHADYELPQDTLRRAVNVDILDSGKLRRRRGSTLKTALAGAHSLWSDGKTAYFALNSTLYRFSETGAYTSLGAFACGTNKVSYVAAGLDIFATSATARVAVKSGVLAPWGLDTPVSPPVVSATVGSLPAGVYHIAVTYLTADGYESGASTMVKITLTVAGGIATTAMPNSSEASATRKRVYVSTTNGEVLYLAAEVSATSQFVSIGTLPGGSELRTAYLSPPPLGSALAMYNGRIFIVDAADQKTVWYTEAYDYGHVNKLKNYLRFDSNVTVIAAVADGLYVCADQTYFIAGAGGEDASQRVVAEFGAVYGSAASIPDTANAIWMSPRGAVIGKGGGAVDILASTRVASGDMIDATAFVREQDGKRQYVAVGSSEDSALRAGSYAEAEIVRRTV